MSSSSVEFIEDDYRNVSGHFDVFVSVGMLEHVGRENYPELGRVIHRTIGDTGRGFLHFIGRNRPQPFNVWIRKRIFPGAYPPTLRESMEVLEPHNYCVLDVENLRMHYAKTLEHWLARFESSFDTVVRERGMEFARMWRLYLAGSVASFRAGNLQLFQVLFAGKPLPVDPLDARAPVRPIPRGDGRRAMDACDVVIVGGGPAGSSCAWALRDSGLDVLIVDRAAFPRNKLCGGWITPLVLDELEFAPEDYPPGRTMQPITGFRLSAIGGPQVEVRGERVVSYGIRRCEFDEYPVAPQRARAPRRRRAYLDRAHERRLAHQRRNPRAHAGRRRRTLLSRRRAISATRDHRPRCWRRKSSSRWTPPQAARIEDRRRTSRAVLLPRHAGLRLGLPQGQLPQCGTRPHRLARNLAPREGFRRLSARRPARSKLPTPESPATPMACSAARSAKFSMTAFC